MNVMGLEFDTPADPVLCQLEQEYITWFIHALGYMPTQTDLAWEAAAMFDALYRRGDADIPPGLAQSPAAVQWTALFNMSSQ